MRSNLAVSFFVPFVLVGVAVPGGAATPQSGQSSLAGASPLPADTSATPAVSPSSQGKTSKVHKWTGSLVDSTCMAEALRQMPSMEQSAYLEPLSQYYLQAVEKYDHPSQGGGMATSMTGPGEQPTEVSPQTPGQPTGSPGLTGEPETSEHELAMQAAQLKRADQLQHQVKMCTPNKPTSHFGMVLSNGQFLRFDTEGDAKVSKALQPSDLPRGRTVKVKVVGVIIKDDNTVTVASIEIKGQMRASQDLAESSSLISPDGGSGLR